MRKAAMVMALLLAAMPACKSSKRGTREMGPPSAFPRLEKAVRARKENVVLVVVDTLRADRLAARRNDVPVMPKLANFSSRSWHFTQAYSQATWTKPAMASILTSLYPEVHNVQFSVNERTADGQGVSTDVLPGSLETMATYFQRQGYQTVAIQTNGHLSKDNGFGQGFHSYVCEQYPAFRANRVTDEAVETLKNVERPFFLYVHYTDPHAPYDPPSRYRTMFGPLPALTPEDRQLLNDYGQYYHARVLNDLKTPRTTANHALSLTGKEHVRALYDGEARFIDDEVMRLIGFIKANVNDCLIIFVADHGEEFWEHGSIGHGRTVYKELAHVPLLLHFPGTGPREVDVPVETIDILPTVASWLDLAPNPAWQGRDLAHVTEIDRGELRPIFSQTRTSLEALDRCLEAVVLGPDKLVLERQSDTRELYNLALDPAEQVNRAAESPRTVKRLAAILKKHRAKNRKRYQESGVRETANASPDTMALLEALGYF